MPKPFILRKKDFFVSPQHAVAVADRYPQDVFAEHTHDFCELVLVWRGNGLHRLNGRPWRITRGDLFYIQADDRHAYTSVQDLVLQNIIYCPERLQLDLDWREYIPGFENTPPAPYWRLGSTGMSQARQLITQLEQESSEKSTADSLMAELLFAQLVLTLHRHRYQPDEIAIAPSDALLDRLLSTLSGSLHHPFSFEVFCAQHHCSERTLRQQFRQQTGMSIPHYLRQLRICHAQYLLRHTQQMISEIALDCGFSDSNYFSVVFNREVGMTPGQWRHQSHTRYSGY